MLGKGRKGLLGKGEKWVGGEECWVRERRGMLGK